jgi:hypothetical protein
MQWWDCSEGCSVEAGRSVSDQAHTMKKIVVFTLVASLLASCATQEEEAPIDRVRKIKEMAELGTTEYTVSKIVAASDDATWYKFGNRKVLFSCEARLKAGIDLSALTDEDITIKDRSVSIVLPKAKLIYLNMEPSKIKEVYTEVSITRSGFSNQEKDAILSQGERSIQAAIPEMGILKTAEDNAAGLVKAFLAMKDFDNVQVTFK